MCNKHFGTSHFKTETNDLQLSIQQKRFVKSPMHSINWYGEKIIKRFENRPVKQYFISF